MEDNASDVQKMDVNSMDLNKIQESISKINVTAGAKAEDALKILIEGAMKKGIMLKDALKINDETMEAVYTHAYNLYNLGKYKDASYIFRLLMMLDSTVPKYILGTAACLHRQKDYINAANLYLLCGSYEPDNPMPHYHSADCYIQLGALSLAILSLQMTIRAAGSQPQYAILKERAELLKAGLTKELEAQMKDLNIPEKEEKKEMSA